MVFEETELRLGLPGNGGGGGFDEGGGHDHVQQQVVVAVMMRKRGFSETETETETADERESSDESSDNAVDLKLNLSNSNNNNNNNKDILLQAAGANHHHNDHKTTANMVMHNKEKNLLPSDPANPPAAKAQVVGWPPVRSFRKNMMAVQKSSAEESEKLSPGSAVLVKVSMDGAPYLRKVDLNMYKNYQELSDALGKMFSSFSTIGNCGSQGMKDFMNESKLMDVLNGSDYVPTYEDKDGDWMLVGDVPWEMFVESCKRLRVMKGKEAVGLAPRAMEKCKNRS